MSMPIHHVFAPLADRRQRLLALKLSYAPWNYKRGGETDALRNALEKLYAGKVTLFATGREALLALLRNRGWAPGDEVIVQGYTCTVIPGAIQAAGLIPVYADIRADTLTMDVNDVLRRITPRTRAIICQHTFGIPGPLKELRELCDKHGLLLIEDCAHMLPDEKGPLPVGHGGDALLLSFGRDKAISGVTGGAIVARNFRLDSVLRQEERNAKDLPLWTIAMLLEYPQIYALAKPFYGSGFGKLILKIAASLGFLVPILSRDEKQGHASTILHRMPNACAALALDQLKRLREFNDHRRMLTTYYRSEAESRGWPQSPIFASDIPMQKYPVFIHSAEKIRSALRAKNIHLNDGWTGCVICPPTVNPADFGYRDGEDPQAEEAGEQILSLPTHPTMTLEQAKRLVEALDPLIP